MAAIVRVGDLVTANALGTTPAAHPDAGLLGCGAAAGSATPDENSSMNDFGECTGCAKGERGGMRRELQQSTRRSSSCRSRPTTTGPCSSAATHPTGPVPSTMAPLFEADARRLRRRACPRPHVLPGAL